MKRLIVIAAVAALVLASCRKDVYPALGDTENAIGFSPYMERVSTKGVVTDVTASNLDEFKVMSYLHGTTTGYFESEQTATGKAAGYYTTGQTYYWPTASNLDFFAYSGSGAGSITNTAGVASLKYTVPAAGTEDFVVAQAVNCSKDATTEKAGMKAQPLTFSHALTKVNSVTLKAKADGIINTANYKFLFTNISIINAKKSATYTFNPASGDNWSSTATGTATYTFTEKAGNFLGSTTKTLKSGSVNDQFIILPQIAIFSITYSIQYSPDGTNNWKEVMSSTTKTVDVKMEMGKAYDITFTLSNNGSVIALTASVEDWTSATFCSDHYVEGGTDYGTGILIAHTIWAPRNCGVGATVNGEEEHPFGLLYQFGRSDGFGYYSDGNDENDGDYDEDEPTIVRSATTAPDSGKIYWTSDGRWYNGHFTEWPMNSPSNGIGNPCPAGWRVPTCDELGSLFFEDWPSDNLTLRGDFDSYELKGGLELYYHYFDDDRKLKLPYAGNDLIETWTNPNETYGWASVGRNTMLYYWSSTVNSEGEVYYFESDPEYKMNVAPSSNVPYGYSVRCVLE